jgi:hypothetical protein
MVLGVKPCILGSKPHILSVKHHILGVKPVHFRCKTCTC